MLFKFAAKGDDITAVVTARRKRGKADANVSANTAMIHFFDLCLS